LPAPSRASAWTSGVLIRTHASLRPCFFTRPISMFSSPDWTYEPKWDGFRVLASVRDGSVRLISRNGHSFTNLFGPVSDALRGFPVSILLDRKVTVIRRS
jgi:bifunctional non-homologous end joining protein LigD